jgi:hypothetical protein
LLLHQFYEFFACEAFHLNLGNLKFNF